MLRVCNLTHTCPLCQLLFSFLTNTYICGMIIYMIWTPSH